MARPSKIFSPGRTNVLEKGNRRRRVASSTLLSKSKSWSDANVTFPDSFGVRITCDWALGNSSCHSPGNVTRVHENRTTAALIQYRVAPVA